VFSKKKRVHSKWKVVTTVKVECSKGQLSCSMVTSKELKIMTRYILLFSEV